MTLILISQADWEVINEKRPGSTKENQVVEEM